MAHLIDLSIKKWVGVEPVKNAEVKKKFFLILHLFMTKWLKNDQKNSNLTQNSNFNI